MSKNVKYDITIFRDMNDGQARGQFMLSIVFEIIMKVKRTRKRIIV